MKRLLLVVACVLILAGPAGAVTFNYLYLENYPVTQWTTPGGTTRPLLGVSSTPGGPLIDVVSNPLEVGQVYYLYAGDDLGNWTQGTAHGFLMCTNDYGSPGIWVNAFYAQGTSGTFPQSLSEWWTYTPQQAWSDPGHTLPTPLPTIWLGWAQGTADKVGDLSHYYDDPYGMRQPDGTNDIYLVLGIGVQPTDAVPLSGAVWLLGSGLLGLVGLRRFRKS
jgi:hypothetical protein